LLAETKFGQFADCMRKNVDTYAEWSNLRHGFKKCDVRDTCGVQAQRCGSATDSSTNDDNAHSYFPASNWL
jgi:hypothetical protein